MGENLELDIESRVLVVEERKKNGKLGEDATGLKFWNEIGYSVSVFMMDRLNVIIVLWNVMTLMPRSQH